MAEWSSFNSGSCSYIDVEVQVSDECEEKLKRLFDQALLIFLEEEGNNRPLPAILGEGKTVDLFKLFVLVREREGFESVSRKGLWDSVAERLGLDCSVSPSLRLVYSKYLDRMEKWAVEKSRVVNWDDGDCKKKGCYGGMLHELGDGFKGLLENGKFPKRNRAMAFGCRHVEESGSESHSPRKRVKECDLDDDDDDEEDVGTSCVVLSDDSEEEGFEKQETLQGMLKWLTSVARCPHDPSIGVIPHCSKWMDYTGSECRWIQVTRAKKALLVQRDNAEIRYQNSPFLGNQTMHPSMYEDDRRSSGRSRYSIRRPHLSIPHCNKSSVSLTKSGSSHCRELISVCESATDVVAGASRARELKVYSNAVKETNKPEIPRRYVAVGRHYQARVDEWTGVSCLDGDDTKWLGTRIWPPENREVLDRSLGKGRPDCCSCEIHTSGSVECIRFHIAEKRMELKRELGDVFFHWRFNQMGEEVSLRWTEREEKMFKKLMVSDPRGFWENAAKNFRGKKREQLVSYYFNVFLINRRRYQNRVTPRNVDSDDEGTFGCVGNSFGRDAVTLIGSDIMICSQNSQCNDFD